MVTWSTYSWVNIGMTVASCLMKTWLRCAEKRGEGQSGERGEDAEEENVIVDVLEESRAACV